VSCPPEGQCILSSILPPPSRYLNAIAAAKIILCKVARAPVSQTSKMGRCTLPKRVRYSRSIDRVGVRLCVGQDRSPVSSRHREEVRSPISPARYFVVEMRLNYQYEPAYITVSFIILCSDAYACVCPRSSNPDSRPVAWNAIRFRSTTGSIPGIKNKLQPSLNLYPLYYITLTSD
jgi:hypothetical protein